VSSEPDQTQPEKKPGIIRRLYAWVLHWADTRYALPALVVLAFTESSFFPIPPDPLLMALCLGKPKKGFQFALWCSVASVAGGILGYYIGFAFYEEVGSRIIHALGYEHHFETVGRLYGENGFFAIVTAAFTPIPYKVFTIAAGVFHTQVPLSTLVIGSAIGRTARFCLVGGVIFFFGPTVKTYLDRYLEVATIGLTVLGILGFIAIKYLH
jgi:membrane protein YqaA with SNARE-associated domain